MNKILGILLAGLTLVGCGQTEPTIQGRWYTASQVAQGGKVYTANCVSCHNENGRGSFNWQRPAADGSYPPPPLDDSAHAWHHPLSQLKMTVEQGGIPMGGKMPAFGNKLKNDEISAVIAYFQSFWSDPIYQEWLKRGGMN